jgi:predicted permease
MDDLRHSLRLLRRTPGFSAAAIAILAIGIGANTAVFSLVNALVLQPRPGRVDSLLGVFSRSRLKAGDYRDFSYPQYLDLRAHGEVFDSLMAHTFTTIGVREGESVRQSFASIVSSNYFSTLGVALARGRAFTPAEERPGAGVTVAIASYAQWRRSGFDPSFVGRIVRINATDFTVVGVAPRGFGGTMTIVSPEWWLPIGAYDLAVNEMFREKTTSLFDRDNRAFNLAGALRAGATRAGAEALLDRAALAMAAEYQESDRDRAFVLAPLPRMSVSSQPEPESAPATISMLLSIMAALVLVVACLNLANLLLARGAARRREIAIRQALGSGRSRIIRQLIVEGLVLSSIGAAFGVLLAWWTTNALASWLAGVMVLGIEIVVEPSARMIGAAAGFALFSTLCFALGPAWSLSRPSVAGELKGEPVPTTRRLFSGPALVVGQLAVSLALVASGGLFVRAAVRAAGANPGFSLDHQLVVALDPNLTGRGEAGTRATYRAVLDRVQAMPGVESAALASTVPYGGMYEGRKVSLPGRDEKVDAQLVIVSSAYFETLKLPLLRGRSFSSADDRPFDSAQRRVSPAIVDISLARHLFRDADPIGQLIGMRLREADDKPADFVVVGVVPTTRNDLFDNLSREEIYTPFGSQFRGSMTMHVRVAESANEAATVAAIQRELRQLDPTLPVLSARTMLAHRDASISEWAVRAAATLFSAFGLLALLLAAVGIYGLKAYEVSRRTREIGIRIALGATARDVVNLVLAEGARTTAVGVCIGLLLAAGLARLVRGMLYEVKPFDPAILAVAVLVLAGAAMAACYVPARRATLVEPLEALRTE